MSNPKLGLGVRITGAALAAATLVRDGVERSNSAAKGLEALARRAVLTMGWSYMPGMKLTMYGRVLDVRGDEISTPENPWDGGGHGWHRVTISDLGHGFALPDLSDAATLGCLRDLVRDWWMDAGAFTHHDRIDGVWRVVAHPPVLLRGLGGHGEVVLFTGATEAEALVAALEAPRGLREVSDAR